MEMATKKVVGQGGTPKVLWQAIPLSAAASWNHRAEWSPSFYIFNSYYLCISFVLRTVSRRGSWRPRISSTLPPTPCMFTGNLKLNHLLPLLLLINIIIINTWFCYQDYYCCCYGVKNMVIRGAHSGMQWICQAVQRTPSRLGWPTPPAPVWRQSRVPAIH